MDFPEDSIQYVLEDWWQTTTPGDSPRRGDLIRVMVPFKFGLPSRIVAKRREDQPGDHESVEFEVQQFSFDSKPPRERLPIAGLPHMEDGAYQLTPFKKRPALVLASAADPLDQKLTNGLAGYQKTPCFLVAPYYGVDKNGSRAGYPEPLVRAIRNCTYPHYFWDCLPLKGDTASSLLRLDSMFSVVSDRHYYQHTGYKLSSDAMEIMAEYVDWYLSGSLPKNSLIRDVRAKLEELGEM